jgi:hypothetical protein
MKITHTHGNDFTAAAGKDGREAGGGRQRTEAAGGRPGNVACARSSPRLRVYGPSLHTKRGQPQAASYEQRAAQRGWGAKVPSRLLPPGPSRA